MKRVILGIGALMALAAAAPAPEVKLWRLDCGSVRVNDLNAFSDTLAYTGQTKTLVGSCYLIRHGDSYMLWDTGLPEAMLGAKTSATDAMSPTLARTITDQLAMLKVDPAQITLIGISHYHFDHTGQAARFPRAKLLIGQGDLDTLRSGKGGGFADPKPLAPWISGGAPVEGVTGDRDVFGDGSVVMLDLPGHTPGHHGLLVRLAHKGPVLLSGDTWHFTEQVARHGIPPFNTNRADSLASEDRLETLARNLKATLIIQHEAADVAKLPAFPTAAD
ncbi:MAG: N-acyl homoserine lactonase family protein [Sphingomonadaceae bacterium]|nr:N-acyl homoserine lactonase family protein [Sphingomonadaceae bacterium]